MAEDIASIGFSVETDGITQGEVALKRLADAGAKVDQSFKKGASGVDAAGRSTKQAGDHASQAAGAFGRASGSVSQLAGASGRARADVDRLSGSVRGASGLIKSFAGALGALSVAGIGSAFFKLSGQVDDTKAQLELMTGSASEAGRVFDRLADIANQTKTDIAGVADAFMGSARDMVELGYSADQAADYTQALSAALDASAIKGQRAESVMYALSKAMGSGKLSGMELNTVLASGGRVAEVIADQLGVSTLKLKELGAEGKITGDVIASALINNLQKLQEESETGARTAADGMTDLRNAVLKASGGLNEATGAGEGLYKVLNGISGAIESVSWDRVVGGAKAAGVAFGALAAATAAYTVAANAATIAATAKTAALALLGKQAAMTAASVMSLGTAWKVAAAAFVGWSVGDYLRSEFQVVEKAGIALMSSLHQWSVTLSGAFKVMGEQIKFAVTEPISFARGVVGDFISWLGRLGTGVASALGFDTSGWEAAIRENAAVVRGAAAEEHQRTLNQIKKDTRAEVAAIADGYFELFNEVGKQVDSGAGKAAFAMDALIDSVRDGSKTAAKAMAVLNKALADGKITSEEYAKALDRMAKVQTSLAGATSDTVKVAKESARAAKAQADEYAKAAKEAVKNADAIKQGNEALKREIQEIGKSKRELVALEQQRNRATIATLDEKIATLEMIEGREAEVAAIREQILAIEERNRLLGERIDVEEVVASQQEIADQWARLSDDMGRTFTDAIIQGGATAREAIKRMFQNMILRPIIEPIAQGVAGIFTGMMGGNSQSGGLMGMLGGGGGSGGIGGLSNLFSAGKGALGFFDMIKSGTLMSSLSGGLGAFTAGFKGATLAPGLMGPTTQGASGMMGAGAAAGQLANMAGPLSVIAGALQGWQAAGFKGAVAGGGGAYLGMKGGAMVGSYFGPIGTAIGGAIGAALGAVGGSKLFGSGEKHKRTVGSATGYYDPEKGYISTGSSADFYAGSRTFGADFNQGLDLVNQQFNEVLGSVFDAFELDTELSTTMGVRLRRTSGRLATDFGVFIDGELQKMFMVQYGGKGNVEGGMEQFADAVMGEYLSAIIQATEELPEHFRNQFDGLTGAEDVNLKIAEIFINFEGVNTVLELAGHAAYELTNEGMLASDTLLELAGGLESLVGAADVYYQNFFTAEEQFEHAFTGMKDALEEAELGAIESREAYRELVEGLDLTTEAGQEMFVKLMGAAGVASEYFGILEGYQAQLTDMQAVLDADPVLGYTAVLEALQADFDQMAKELDVVGLATAENLDILSQFSQLMKELAALDLFEGGQDMADALRQGLLGTWDGEDIGHYLARSISDGVYGAIAGQFANQITDILMQGVVAPMINAALTGATISEAVTKESIAAMVAQAQAVAGMAAEVMDALRESGVMKDLQEALGGSFSMPSVSYTMPAYSPPVVSQPAQKVDDSWKSLLESIISQTKRAQQQIADMGRSTYEKGLAGIAGTVADFQDQIAKSTASKRKLLTEELAKLEAAERELLELQMDQRAADLLGGLADEMERMGKTDAELALMDIDRQTREYIEALKDVGRATAENILQVESWADAMKEAAAKDAQIKAAGDAYDALSRAMDTQRSVITEALELARSVADTAGRAAQGLFADVLGATAGSAAQARSFIADALQTARATGYLPDSDELQNAIDAATRGFDSAAAVSAADAQWQKLVLANQLKELSDLAEPQADIAQQQLDAMDAALQAAKDQIDLLQGIDTSVLSVAEALQRFNDTVGGDIQLAEVRQVQMPPASVYEPNAQEDRSSGLLAEVIELRRDLSELRRDTKRTADAVNGRGDAPMIVEVV